MNPNDKYPLFIHWYKTLDWIMDIAEKMPKHTRFTINTRIVSISLEIVEYIVEAIYTKDRAEPLRHINLLLEKLRIFFRICKDRAYISVKQYEYISLQLNEAGKMCGGWAKQKG